MAVKKIPMRKCAGCEEMKEKKQLVRVVRTPEGEFVLDGECMSARAAAVLRRHRKNVGLNAL